MLTLSCFVGLGWAICTYNQQNQLINTIYQSTEISLGCPVCPFGCETCGGGACSRCIRSFFLSGSTCRKCSTPFCLTCLSDVCSACISGFYISGVTCLKCPANSVCLSSTFISSCFPAHFSTQYACVPCSTGCNVCTSTSCSACLRGYVLILATSLCAQCPNNCQFCVVNTACRTCAPAFVLSNAQCVAIVCVANCQYCSNTVACIACKQGYFLSSGNTCSPGGSFVCAMSIGVGYNNCQSLSQYNKCSSKAEQDISFYNLAPNYCLSLAFTTTQNFEFFPSPGGVCLGLASLASGGRSYDISSIKSVSHYQIAVRMQLLLKGVTSPDSATIGLQLGSGTVLSTPVAVQSSSLTTVCSTANSVFIIFQTSFRSDTLKVADLISSASYNLVITAGTGYSEALLGEVQVEMSLCDLQNCMLCGSQSFCKQCKPAYYLQLNSCLQTCSSGFFTQVTGTLKQCVIACREGYYPNYNQLSCDLCSNSCLTCRDSVTCLSCTLQNGNVYYLNQTSCVSSCQVSNKLYFANQDQKICSLCINPCKECAPFSGTTCLSCNVGYSLSQTSCLPICPAGFYGGAQTSGGVQLFGLYCSSCDPACTTCYLSSTLCLSCAQNKVVQNFVCVNACPDLQYSKAGVCEFCSNPCLNCVGSSTSCTSCVFGLYYLQPSPTGASANCLTLCPDKFYASSGVCVACPPGCNTCQSNNICISCLQNYFLNKQSCVSAASCPSGTFAKAGGFCFACSPPCSTCANQATQCSSCKIGYLNPNTKTCGLFCLAGTFPNQFRICRTCHASCRTCTGQTAALCTSCSSAAGYYYNRATNTCVQTCPDGLVANSDPSGNGVCIACSPSCLTCIQSASNCVTCPVSKFFSQGANGGSCLDACNTNQLFVSNQCRTCTPPCYQCATTVTNCVSCLYPYLLSGSNCILDCTTLNSPNQFNDFLKNSVCSPCALTACAKCINDLFCQTCATGKFFYQNYCYDSCPSGLIANNGFCKTCSEMGVANCNICSNSNCLVCFSSYSLNQNSCVQKCPDNYYSSQVGNSQYSECKSCVSPCATCSSSLQCLTCVTNNPPYNYFETAKLCVVSCPEGMYTASGRCTNCANNCRTCSSSQTCLSCGGIYYLKAVDSTCVQQCSSDRTLLNNPIGNTCVPCLFPCSTCSSTVYNCLTCVQGYVFLLGCFAACPIGFRPNSGNICIPCPPENQCYTCDLNAHCTSCNGAYFLSENICISRCQPGFYPEASTLGNTCRVCGSTCTTCSDSITCITCKNSAEIVKFGVCVSSCGQGYFAQGGNCVSCSPFCIECTSLTLCSACSNAYLHQGSCYLTCPRLTFPDSGALECASCSSPCLTCADFFICTTCVPGYLLLGDECFPEGLGCPLSFWLTQDNSCAENCLPPLLQYKEKRQCFRKCPYYMYASGSDCLSSCPSDHYYDSSQQCSKCAGKCTLPFFNISATNTVSGTLAVVLYFSVPFNVTAANQSFTVRITNLSSSTVLPSRLLQTLSNVSFEETTPRFIRLLLPPSNYSNVEVTVLLTNRDLVYSLDPSKSQLQNYKATTKVYQASGYSSASVSIKLPLNTVGTVVSIVLLLIELALLLLDRLYLVYHLIELSQYGFLLLLLMVNYPPPLAGLLLGLRPLHFWFINPDIVPASEFTPAPPSYYLYTVDGTFLRSVGMDFIIGILVLLFAAVIFVLNRTIARAQHHITSLRDLQRKSTIISHKPEPTPESHPTKAEKVLAVLTMRSYNLFTDGLQLVYLNLATFTFSQLSQFSFNSGFEVVNGLLTAGTVVFLVGCLPVLGYLLSHYKRRRHSLSADLRAIGPLVAEIQPEQEASKFRNLFTMFRKLVFAITIGLFANRPIYCLVISVVLLILSLGELYFFAPYSLPWKNYFVMAFEASAILVFILFIAITLEHSDNNRYSESISLPTAVILLILFVAGAVLAIYELAIEFINLPLRIRTFIQFINDPTAPIAADYQFNEQKWLEDSTPNEPAQVRPSELLPRLSFKKKTTRREEPNLEDLQFINYNDYEQEEEEEAEPAKKRKMSKAPEYLIKIKNM